MAGTDRGPSRFVGYQPNELTGVPDMKMLMDGIPARHMAPVRVPIQQPRLGSWLGLCGVEGLANYPLG